VQLIGVSALPVVLYLLPVAAELSAPALLQLSSNNECTPLQNLSFS
jgi:hypothetical protein